MISGKFKPEWNEKAPAPGTYRSITKYGDPHHFKHPSDAWVKMMQEDFHMSDEDFTSRINEGNEKVVLNRPPSLKADQIRKLAGIVGGDNVAIDDYSRVKYASGKTTEEMLELRKGIIREVADVVVHPRDKHDVQKIVAYCNQERIPITVFSAGSSVNFGCRPVRGGVSLVISTHMNRLLEINELNQTARVQPGMYGPAYEEALNKAPEMFGTKLRYTCGHFPQSFEYSTVGGWIVTLGSGQASTYYGDAYDIVFSQEYVTPVGTFKTLDYPATATGPKINDIMKGSEGCFGILVEVTMKIFRHMPDNRARFSYMYPTWEAAVGASREIMQSEFGKPAIYRISDPEETDRGLKLYGMPGIADKFLTMRGFKPMQRCLCLGNVEGDQDYTRLVAHKIKKIARKYGAMSLGGYAARKWEHTRYTEPYMREDLGDYGILIDTLEAAVTWDNLHNLHKGVREYIKSRPDTMCMTHASHFYPQGTNLYFIFILKMDDPDEFRKFQRGIVENIQKYGGSLSHHHGVGRMIGPWMQTHLGKEQMDVLRALKKHFDPNGIMNPGGQLGLD
ncbi:MAG TPA: FAD-binding oxidoreductase [Smithellaceae bacterium]|nr:FAD-binding oxidoreductase [Smithellaceae bacterium]HQF84830.1 FAD-binding oxidoreductase [Smithellaceae bacterium]HQG81082.1 FAD-binding oxidoreductase [Smithellaceae bacterium]